MEAAVVVVDVDVVVAKVEVRVAGKQKSRWQRFTSTSSRNGRSGSSNWGQHLVSKV